MIRDFESRHIGPRSTEIEYMLNTVGVRSIDELIDQTIPQGIRRSDKLSTGEALSEHEYLAHIRKLEAANKVYKTYIGLGYYNTITPSVILRNIFENPGWYTAYTPYQAEIAQGRLEALLNYQTMIMSLTGMELANASLLDEATAAAAEAMHMFFAMRSRDQVKNGANKLFISEYCFPQTIELLKTRSAPLGIELVLGDPLNYSFSSEVFGAVLQYPDSRGEIEDYSSFCAAAHENQSFVCVCADIMSLVLLSPPGEWGADCVVGNTQRFGVPMGYGGPHAAYFATRESFKRFIPGRIIGVSVDAQGSNALRMALQTREQHIKRDKATSNICTAQALLAIMASMYAVYHGPKGLQNIASKIHSHTRILAEGLQKLGYTVPTKVYFGTISVQISALTSAEKLMKTGLEHEINLRYSEDGSVMISLDETTSAADVQELLNVFALAGGKEPLKLHEGHREFWPEQKRSSEILKERVFNAYHSETEMMRYIKRLEKKDLALNHSMISLGSCTMKLNAATELMPLSWNGFANLHPFIPVEQAEGYHKMFAELSRCLADATGFSAVSLQPNSGAQGEYAGLMTIRAYHLSRGDNHRNIALIPSSAHGTNPASAVMAGMQVVVVSCDERGNVDIEDLRQKAEKHKDSLSCLMITYPSTHGVYEEGIRMITGIIHENGGLVYMDGANMNAQVGLTSPGNIGADVCHLNLHKTFAIPHGGGGPGMGPIGVNDKLKPFLPGHSVIPTGGSQAIHAVSAAPFGSSLILLVSYAYIKMLGSDGLTNATKFAIFNANYLRARLEAHFPVLYKGSSGHVAHEMIIDCREFKRTAGIEVADIAKRLMDYGYHAPTVSFPVAGTMMIEPTESEGLEELDRFCEAMISIRNEIAEIETGLADKLDNVLLNSPHTQSVICNDEWKHSYSRSKAAFPLNWISENKFWPSVGRVDNAYGDRNLICSCAPMESYLPEELHS
ncbi:MAG: aminomethyl-transferring glycine dehydrogenase [Bacteroidia bacterium]